METMGETIGETIDTTVPYLFQLLAPIIVVSFETCDEKDNIVMKLFERMVKDSMAGRLDPCNMTKSQREIMTKRLDILHSTVHLLMDDYREVLDKLMQLTEENHTEGEYLQMCKHSKSIFEVLDKCNKYDKLSIRYDEEEAHLVFFGLTKRN